MDRRELTIQLALAEYNQGLFPSIRATSRAHNVPERTLRRRLAGTQDRRTAHAHEQRLLPTQEAFLVEWILEQEAQGFPPSHARAREMATRILRMNGDTRPLGKRWLQKFIRDTPSVASVIGRPIEAARVNRTHPNAIQEFYNMYEEVVRTHNIQPCNTWNMDEHGIALRVCANSTVLRDSSRHRAYVKSP
ncbi:hypothetical protein D6D01_08363 [Aureobasidium pullulans]|uniref:HTH CENPB-type domain-containing protein n=1 Tax=Aureobasidium pullulans TaxID=5580 RepID=A0A4S9KDH7_AURPU|nr:hypothetical protein D6D01_08363 [Aureobasidium pullulans]